jgi:hypothetical protein
VPFVITPGGVVFSGPPEDDDEESWWEEIREVPDKDSTLEPGWFGALRAALQQWMRDARYGSRARTLRHAYNEHGSGQGYVQYTNEARSLWNSSKNKGRPIWITATSEWGVKVDSGNVYGIYTQSGEIVSYGYNP